MHDSTATRRIAAARSGTPASSRQRQRKSVSPQCAAAAAPPAPASSKVVCIGDPVVDVVVFTSDEYLGELGLEKGGQTTVESAAVIDDILAGVADKDPVIVSGGSAANVAKGIAQLTLDKGDVSFIGCVGHEEAGAQYVQTLEKSRVRGEMVYSETSAPTATALCLVTPDGQRTMRVHLGAAVELNASNVPLKCIEGASLVHIEGYALFRPEMVEAALRAGRAAGALTSLDLASFEVVRICRAEFLRLFDLGLVDLAFCNEQEALALVEGLCEDTGDESACDVASEEQHIAAAHRALDFFVERTRLATVTLGAQGCICASSDGAPRVSEPALRVQATDTTGAGDSFTGAFLAQLLRGGTPAQCAHAGCVAGAAVVQSMGASLTEDAWEGVRAAMEDGTSHPLVLEPHGRR
mmetsp:Transcript_12678/g.41789  ORF Transcript_12678/g.41789 Transcript_12678/m.41789 type:complete len:410 (-) Transcript_12678:2282-3511(-)